MIFWVAAGIILFVLYVWLVANLSKFIDRHRGDYAMEQYRKALEQLRKK
jgi:hypothetical protein